MNMVEMPSRDMAQKQGDDCREAGHRVSARDDPATFRAGWRCRTCGIIWFAAIAPNARKT